MSGKRKSQSIEESAKKPKLDAEICVKFMDTKNIPDVVWQNIFGFLSWKQIKFNVARVCRHFNEISNDCVQVINIHENALFASSHVLMFEALSNFKFLKSIKIECNKGKKYAKSIDFFLMHALKNCPRLRFIETSHELSTDFLNHIAKHGEKLYGLYLYFGNTNTQEILSPLKKGMKNLKCLGLFCLERSNFKDGDLLSLLENCKELNSINIQDCEIAVDTMFELINLKKDKLKHLNFGQINIGDGWLQELGNCPNFEWLTIASMDITDSGFEAISKLKNLKTLQFGYSHDQRKEFKTDDLIKMMANGKFENLKQLYVFGIHDSIGELLLSAAFACPNLRHLICECMIDSRKSFPKNIIQILLDNLPELMRLNIEWILHHSDTNSTENPIFVKSEVDTIVGKCKNKFEVVIEDDTQIDIMRAM